MRALLELILNLEFILTYGKERNLENSDSDHHHCAHGDWHEPGDVELYVRGAFVPV